MRAANILSDSLLHGPVESDGMSPVPQSGMSCLASMTTVPVRRSPGR